VENQLYAVVTEFYILIDYFVLKLMMWNELKIIVLIFFVLRRELWPGN
jgi:hypothetical protein